MKEKENCILTGHVLALCNPCTVLHGAKYSAQST